MEALNIQKRRVPGRVPLSDGSAIANVLPTEVKAIAHAVPASTGGSVAQNEFAIDPVDSRHPLPSSKYQRVSTVAEDEIGNSKRNSAMSTASTNASGSARRRKTHIGPWQLGQTIGKGGTSRVRKVRHTITGEPAVAKIIPKAVADKNCSLSLANLVKCAERGDPSLAVGKVIPFGLEREIVIMKLLNHPNIVRLFDVWENRNELYLIMEHVEGGELFEYVAQRHHLDERETIYLFRQIIAALLYCHRLHIHHRDLKPENILLNLNTLEVKLVDFGMAALQPEGGLLTAPCGSPHYAAPEVITTKAYDGSKADVWSCGVTLFLMLAGYPPFNLPYDPHNIMPEDKKLRALYRTICRAEYKLPGTLSPEAKDLITKILVPKPKDRISIEQLWYHPLLHKYDGDFGLTETTIEASIGPQTIIEYWERLTVKTIDREIFRNLRTLWHSEREKVLVEKLCSEEPNQEKYFYSALLKYREENLENMLYSPGAVEYSASDYQHTKPAKYPEKIPSTCASKGSHQRSRSQYSVLNNEHLYSRHTFFDNLSEESYDPFRASKELITNARNNYVNVTVHRSVSNGSKKLNSRPSSSRKPSSLRVEALRKTNRGESGLSIASTLIRRSPPCRIATSRRSTMSRTSMQSGQWLSSPPIATIRPSNVHKRTVNFSHLRKSSTTSGLASQAGSDQVACSPDQRPHQHQTRYKSGDSLAISPFSPQYKVVAPVVGKKEIVLPVQPTPRTRKMKDIENEARKVSVELEKACDEAFFRSSISSSIKTSTTDRPNHFYDTPPSSVSNWSGQAGNKLQFTDEPTLVDRPLPPIPVSTSIPPAETPQTFTARELVGVRDRLARTYAEQGVSSEKAFHDLLNQLDNLLPFEARRSADGTRSSSAPYPSLQSSQQPPNTNNLLHAIPEEGCFADGEVEISCNGRKIPPRRVATAPSSRRYDFSADSTNNPTIRVVPSSPPSPPSPTPVAPLNIRKRSHNNNATYDTMSENGTEIASRDQIEPSTFVHPLVRPSWWKHDEQMQHKAKKVEPRRDLSDLDDRYARRKERYECEQRELEGQQQGQAANNSSQEHATIESEGMKRGFFSFFKKKPTPTHVYELKDESKGTVHTTHRSNEIPTNLPSEACEASEPRNVLARIFHFKPEVKTLALHVHREEVMYWLFHLLRAHSDKGLKDIHRSEAAANEFSVTVDKKNYYGIKPCKFVVEGFQILTDGQDATLCVLRFTQTSGAASSMRKVIREITKALKIKKTTWLVDDRKEAKKVCDCVKLA